MTTLADPDHSPAGPADPHPVPPRDGEGPRIAVIAAIIVAFVALVAAIYLGVESRSAGQSRDGLRSKLEMAEQELATLKRAGADRDALKAESEKLQGLLQQGRSALAEATQRRDQAAQRDSYGRLNADSAAVNGQLAQATEQLGKTQGDLAAARQQLADLQAQIARTAEELKRQPEAPKP